MSNELKTIDVKNRDERASLALITKEVDTLYWFLPDIELNVKLNIIKNPLFDRDMLDRSKYLEFDIYEIKDALLKTNLLHEHERAKIKKEVDILKKEKTKNDKILEAFCPLPWNHLGIKTNGGTRICCQMIYKPFGDLGVNVKDIKDINDVRNLPPVKLVRKQMLQGIKPKLCELCWTEEKSDLKSKRIHQNIIYPDALSQAERYTNHNGEIDTKNIPLNYFDLRLGNKCNLACRSCGPTESNLWYKDYWTQGHRSIQVPDGLRQQEYELKEEDGQITINSNDFDWPDNTTFLNQILDSCNNIDRIYFTGGEPTINHAHIQFLQKLVDYSKSQDIFLEYNSNGMAMPESLLNIWPKFKGVGIGFSIDGMEEKFEYLRYPGKWDKFIRTITKLHTYHKSGNSVQVVLAPTISIYNCLHMLDLYNFILYSTPPWFGKTMPIHVLESPAYMSPKILPNHAKLQIKTQYYDWIKKLQLKGNLPGIRFGRSNNFKKIAINNMTNLIHYIDQTFPDPDQLLNDFYTNTENKDKQRNQNWKEVFPELVDVLS